MGVVVSGEARVARIGVLNISDGRDYVHDGIAQFSLDNEDKLVAALTAAGHEVVRGRAPVSTNTLATSVAREVAAQDVDLTILHYCVWAFPHFTMLAAGATTSPPVLLAHTYPRLRAAAAGSAMACGVVHVC